MMKFLPLIILVFFFSTCLQPISAQNIICHDIGIEDDDHHYDKCLDKVIPIVDGICCCYDPIYKMTPYSGPEEPEYMCGEGPNAKRFENPHYFAFVADGTAPFSIIIEPIYETCFRGILPSPHNTIRATFIDLLDCNADMPISTTCGQGCTPGPISLTTQFVPFPGQVIGIVVDGCGPVVCDFRIDFVSGWTNNNLVTPPEENLVLLSKVVDDGTLGCKEMTFSMSAAIDKVCEYLWTLPDGSTITTTNTKITVNVDDFPDGEVCVQGINEFCFPGQLFPEDPSGTTLCLPFTREDPIVDLGYEPTTCGRDNGTAFFLSTNGDGPFTYQWNTGENTLFIDDLSPGTYTMTLTDDKGCTAVNSIVVPNSDPLSTSFQVTPTKCDNKSGSITVNGIGGSGIYNYFWAHDVTPDNTLINLGTGTYTVTVVDIYDTECNEVVNVTVGLMNDLELDIIETIASDCGEDNGSINFTANLKGNYKYTILGPGGPYTGNLGDTIPDGWTVNGLPAGDFTIHITDASGAKCQTDPESFTIDGGLSPEVDAGEDALICGNLNSTLEGTVTLGTATWTQVSGPGTTTFTNNSNPTTALSVDTYGTYIYRLSATLEDCDATPDEVTLIFNENPTFTVEEICNGQDGIFVATISGGTPPYALAPPSNISGNFVGNTFTSDPVNAGINYTMKIVDDRGCESTVVNLTHQGLPELSVVNDAIVLGCGDPSSGQITVSVNGTNSPDLNDYDFNWSLGTSTTNVMNFNQSGNYVLEVTDKSTGCTSTISVNVTIDQNLPQINAGADVDLLCTSNTVTLNSSTNISGGIYEWSGAGIVGANSGSSIQVNAPGVYTVKITNPTNGCENSDSVEVIDERITPDVEAGANLVIDCQDLNGEIFVSGTSTTSGVIYTWSTTNGSIVGNNNTAQIRVNQAGTYTLTVRNPANGCEDSDTMVVTSDVDEPDLSVPSGLVINCYNEETGINIAANSSISGLQYQWTPSGGGSLSGPNNVREIIGLTPGTYSVTITNPSNNCTNQDQVVVTGDFDDPDVEAGPDETIDCSNLNAQLSGSTSAGNVSYLWTTNGGAINPPTNTATVTVVSDGIYVLTVTDLDNGCSAQDQLTVLSLDELPDLAVAQNNIPFYCTSDIITLNANSSVPGVIYNWTVQSGGGVVGGLNSSELQVNGPGQYRVTVLDPASDCTRSVDVNVIDEREDPNANAGEDLVLNCSDNGIKTITGSSSTPNVSYEWTNSSMEVVGNSATITVSEPGIYTLTVTNNVNGCTATSQMELEANEDIPQLSTPDALIIDCYTKESGIELEASSTTGGVDFEWNNGETGTSITVLNPGTYEVTVTNPENGCTNVDQIEVTTDFAEPEVNAGEDAVVDCEDTEATLTGNTDISNGTYLWSAEGGGSLAPPLNQPTVVATREGTYRLTVTNPSNGCSSSDVVAVTSSVEIPVVTVDEFIILGCGEFSSEFVQGISSIADVDYEWTVISGPGFGSDPNESGVLITGPGLYELSASDPTTGCVGFAQVEVVMTDDLPEAEAGEDQELTCEIEEITLSGGGSSGNNLTYFWESVDMGTTITNPTQRDIKVGNSGEFKLTVTNAGNGCSDSDLVSIYAEDDVLSNFIVDVQDISCKDDNNGRLQITEVIGGVPPINIFFQGEDVEFQNTFNMLGEGDYEIKIVDSKGCERTKKFTFSDPYLLRVNMGQDVTINEGDILKLEAIVSGRDFTTDTVSIVWDTLDVQFGLDEQIIEISPSRSMTVGVTVTDKNGCVARSTIYVTVIRDVQIFVPNIFSPNRDGTNDYLIVHAGKEVVKFNNFIIYDRWGNLIYELKDFEAGEKTKGWDGTFVGKTVPAGVYVYYLNVTLTDGTIHKMTGDVTVVF